MSFTIHSLPIKGNAHLINSSSYTHTIAHKRERLWQNVDATAVRNSFCWKDAGWAAGRACADPQSSATGPWHKTELQVAAFTWVTVSNVPGTLCEWRTEAGFTEARPRPEAAQAARLQGAVGPEQPNCAGRVCPSWNNTLVTSASKLLQEFLSIPVLKRTRPTDSVLQTASEKQKRAFQHGSHPGVQLRQLMVVYVFSLFLFSIRGPEGVAVQRALSGSCWGLAWQSTMGFFPKSFALPHQMTNSSLKNIFCIYNNGLNYFSFFSKAGMLENYISPIVIQVLVQVLS